MTPHLEQEIKPGQNVLWCSTFQLAWNELRTLAGGDIQMENAPPIVAALNRGTASKADLDEASYVAMAGFVRDGIIKDIQAELDRKFAGKANAELMPPPIPLGPSAWVAYAFLYKDLPFKWAFQRDEFPLSFEGTAVASFGIYEYLFGDEKKLLTKSTYSTTRTMRTS